MGRMQNMDIVFDNSMNVYHAGQSLAGKLVLTLTDNKKAERIVIEFKGKAKTHWSRHHGKSSTHYSSEEYYFNSCWDPGFVNRYEDGRIPPGTHEIPFSFPLPSNLPSSFEGPHGHIRYTCTARLVRTWKFDITCRRPFTVIAREDLNECPAAAEPLNMIESTALECFCFPRGAISISLYIPKRGFVPGEGLPMAFDITNNSTKTIKHITARVKQYVIYRGQSFWGYEDSKDTSTEVARICADDAIGAGATRKWENNRLVIPAVPPCLVGCGIIDVSYALKLDVDRYINFTLPLIVGTVPLRTSVTARPGHSPSANPHIAQDPDNEGPPPSFSEALLLTGAYGSGDDPPSYPETPPPAYQECVFGGFDIREDGDDENTLGDSMFAPRYVYYSRENLGQSGSENSPLLLREHS